MDLFILSQDLFVTSRVEGVAKTLMLSYETAPSISHLQTSWANSPAKVLIIDLTLPKLDLKEIDFSNIGDKIRHVKLDESKEQDFDKINI